MVDELFFSEEAPGTEVVPPGRLIPGSLAKIENPRRFSGSGAAKSTTGAVIPTGLKPEKVSDTDHLRHALGGSATDVILLDVSGRTIS